MTRSKIEAYNKIKSDIEDIIKQEIPVVVEGKNDEEALRSLGVDNIVTNKATHKIVEKLKEEEQVALLVDLDKAGKQIYHRLKENLIRFGVKINDDLRNSLFKYTDLRQIEGLKTYLEGIEEEINHPSS